MIRLLPFIGAFLCSCSLFANVDFEIYYSDEFHYDLDDSLKYVDYFPGKNYQRVVQDIKAHGAYVFPSTSRRLVYEVPRFDFSLLSGVHTDSYGALLKEIVTGDWWKTQRLSKSQIVAFLENASFVEIAKQVDGMPVSDIASVAKELVRAQALGTSGTIHAMRMASSRRTGAIAAINLSGGYHHAHADHPSGFCLINDVAVAVNEFLKSFPDGKVLIVDLDAHLGDGNEEIFRENHDVVIFDIYNRQIFPFSSVGRTKERHFRFGIPAYTNDEDYLELIKRELPRVLDLVKPDLIMYNAGTDIYEHDPLGALSISSLGIIHRDELVFRLSLEQNPHARIVMVLSGGYATGPHLSDGVEDIFSIIARSIINLKMTFGTELAQEPSRKKIATDLPEAPKNLKRLRRSGRETMSVYASKRFRSKRLLERQEGTCLFTSKKTCDALQ